MNKTKRNSGFSIMETVIALAIIVIVTFAALTVVMSSISARVKQVNHSEAQDFAHNVLECFKASDDISELEANIKFAEGKDVTLTSSGTDIYTYTSEKNNFTATITANFTNGNFDISVIDNKGNEIVSFDYDKYVSQEGGT